MGRKFYNTILLLTASLISFSQATLTGKVVNAATNEALPGASIYFNNTSIGTASNEQGEFSIELPGISNLELIISSIGFETIVHKIQHTDNTQRPYLIKMNVREPMLQDVLLLPDVTRVKYLKLFKENFLGITREAAKSSIKNLHSVYFTNPENEKNCFHAGSDTPLVIINNFLGYKIYFELQDFYYNETTRQTSFYGFTRFEEMGDKKKWIKNRKKAYYGSTIHFFRSLISDKLEEESYRIFFIKEDTIRTDTGRRAVSAAIPATALQVVKKDTLNSDNYIVAWKNKLMVQYGKDPASKEYLRSRIFLNGNMHVGVQSYLVMNDAAIIIDKFGVLLDPLSVFVSGYWIYEKAANLLPYNYYPEPE